MLQHAQLRCPKWEYTDQHQPMFREKKKEKSQTELCATFWTRVTEVHGNVPLPLPPKKYRICFKLGFCPAVFIVSF